MENGIGNKADISFFKFCYVDINPETNVEKVFTEYENTMSRLEKTYPKTMFVHVTIPLTTTQTGIKAWIKKLIGRAIGGYDENAKRNEFNDLITEASHQKEPVLDLAKIESTAPDGKRSVFTRNGQIYYSLAPIYTHDGGHLNELGRKRVAEQLLLHGDPLRLKAHQLEHHQKQHHLLRQKHRESYRHLLAD